MFCLRFGFKKRKRKGQGGKEEHSSKREEEEEVEAVVASQKHSKRRKKKLAVLTDASVARTLPLTSSPPVSPDSPLSLFSPVVPAVETPSASHATPRQTPRASVSEAGVSSGLPSVSSGGHLSLDTSRSRSSDGVPTLAGGALQSLTNSVNVLQRRISKKVLTGDDIVFISSDAEQQWEPSALKDLPAVAPPPPQPTSAAPASTAPPFPAIDASPFSLTSSAAVASQGTHRLSLAALLPGRKASPGDPSAPQPQLRGPRRTVFNDSDSESDSDSVSSQSSISEPEQKEEGEEVGARRWNHQNQSDSQSDDADDEDNSEDEQEKRRTPAVPPLSIGPLPVIDERKESEDSLDLIDPIADTLGETVNPHHGHHPSASNTAFSPVLSPSTTTVRRHHSRNNSAIQDSFTASSSGRASVAGSTRSRETEGIQRRARGELSPFAKKLLLNYPSLASLFQEEGFSGSEDGYIDEEEDEKPQASRRTVKRKLTVPPSTSVPAVGSDTDKASASAMPDEEWMPEAAGGSATPLSREVREMARRLSHSRRRSEQDSAFAKLKALESAREAEAKAAMKELTSPLVSLSKEAIACESSQDVAGNEGGKALVVEETETPKEQAPAEVNVSAQPLPPLLITQAPEQEAPPEAENRNEPDEALPATTSELKADSSQASLVRDVSANAENSPPSPPSSIIQRRRRSSAADKAAALVANVTLLLEAGGLDGLVKRRSSIESRKRAGGDSDEQHTVSESSKSLSKPETEESAKDGNRDDIAFKAPGEEASVGNTSSKSLRDSVSNRSKELGSIKESRTDEEEDTEVAKISDEDNVAVDRVITVILPPVVNSSDTTRDVLNEAGISEVGESKIDMAPFTSDQSIGLLSTAAKRETSPKEDTLEKSNFSDESHVTTTAEIISEPTTSEQQPSEASATVTERPLPVRDTLVEPILPSEEPQSSIVADTSKKLAELEQPQTLADTSLQEVDMSAKTCAESNPTPSNMVDSMSEPKICNQLPTLVTAAANEPWFESGRLEQSVSSSLSSIEKTGVSKSTLVSEPAPSAAISTIVEPRPQSNDTSLKPGTQESVASAPPVKEKEETTSHQGSNASLSTITRTTEGVQKSTTNAASTSISLAAKDVQAGQKPSSSGSGLSVKERVKSMVQSFEKLNAQNKPAQPTPPLTAKASPNNVKVLSDSSKNDRSSKGALPSSLLEVYQFPADRLQKNGGGGQKGRDAVEQKKMEPQAKPNVAAESKPMPVGSRQDISELKERSNPGKNLNVVASSLKGDMESKASRNEDGSKAMTMPEKSDTEVEPIRKADSTEASTLLAKDTFTPPPMHNAEENNNTVVRKIEEPNNNSGDLGSIFLPAKESIELNNTGIGDEIDSINQPAPKHSEPKPLIIVIPHTNNQTTQPSHGASVENLSQQTGSKESVALAASQARLASTELASESDVAGDCENYGRAESGDAFPVFAVASCGALSDGPAIADGERNGQDSQDALEDAKYEADLTEKKSQLDSLDSAEEEGKGETEFEGETGGEELPDAGGVGEEDPTFDEEIAEGKDQIDGADLNGDEAFSSDKLYEPDENYGEGNECQIQHGDHLQQDEDGEMVEGDFAEQGFAEGDDEQDADFVGEEDEADQYGEADAAEQEEYEAIDANEDAENESQTYLRQPEDFRPEDNLEPPFGCADAEENDPEADENLVQDEEESMEPTYEPENGGTQDMAENLAEQSAEIGSTPSLSIVPPEEAVQNPAAAQALFGSSDGLCSYPPSDMDLGSAEDIQATSIPSLVGLSMASMASMASLASQRNSDDSAAFSSSHELRKPDTTSPKDTRSSQTACTSTTTRRPTAPVSSQPKTAAKSAKAPSAATTPVQTPASSFLPVPARSRQPSIKRKPSITAAPSAVQGDQSLQKHLPVLPAKSPAASGPGATAQTTTGRASVTSTTTTRSRPALASSPSTVFMNETLLARLGELEAELKAQEALIISLIHDVKKLSGKKPPTTFMRPSLRNKPGSTGGGGPSSSSVLYLPGGRPLRGRLATPVAGRKVSTEMVVKTGKRMTSSGKTRNGTGAGGAGSGSNGSIAGGNGGGVVVGAMRNTGSTSSLSGAGEPRRSRIVNHASSWRRHGVSDSTQSLSAFSFESMLSSF
ncbi:hypothetical protein HDU96_005731 [Phlyctochytrium bullatum]|nr:hypothetical protein HDU96_005731 [Phlyctochytrium bullatum]